MKKPYGIISILMFSLLTGFGLLTPNPQQETGILALRGEGCLVLCYHRVRADNVIVESLNSLSQPYIEDDELTLYSVSLNNFKKQMKFLKENNANFITAAELDAFIKKRRPLPPKSVLVTFDDIDISVYNNAFPFLKEEKIPFTLFIITGHIGDQDFKGLTLCNAAQIQEMVDSGLATLGSHSHKYHYFDKLSNPPFMNPENTAAFGQDAQLSFETLKTCFGTDKKYFSYPYGFGMPETDHLLMDLGVDLIFSLRPGIVQAGDPSFFIKRILVHEGTWDSIANWVTSSPEPE
ncbi:MAG TPA: polysaccharide deacetylase family protein [Peptococcaceae bacterium]|nr:polysaccharide deacetylase family protein [Peptococcaceae bacterium]